MYFWLIECMLSRPLIPSFSSFHSHIYYYFHNIVFFYLASLCIFDKKLMVIIYVRIIYCFCHKNHESLIHIVQKFHPRLNIVFIIGFLYNLVNL
jgi:hypothetical protein